MAKAAVKAAESVKQIKTCTSDNYRRLDELKSFGDNPRTLTDSGFKRLRESLEQLGLFKPLLVRKEDNTVIGGNQRFLVMQSMIESGEFAVKKVPVTIVDVDEATARMIVLRDNQSDGDWHYEKLSGYLRELKGMTPDINMGLTGFDEKQLRDILALTESPEELRKRLGEELKDSDKDLTKNLPITFAIPKGEREVWDNAFAQLKEITGSDDVWTNIKELINGCFGE